MQLIQDNTEYFITLWVAAFVHLMLVWKNIQIERSYIFRCFLLMTEMNVL